MTGLAAVVSLLAATCFALCAVAQHRAVGQMETTRAMNPRLILLLIRSPLWWAATAGDLAGFLLQAVALGLGAVALVQPLLVSGLLIAIPVSAAVNKRRPRRGELIGAGICCAGLAVFLAAGHPEPGRDSVPVWEGMILAAALAAVTLVLVLVAHRARGRSRAIALAAAAGVLFGASAPLLRLVATRVDDPLLALTSWPLPVLIGTGLVGFLLSQNAFQAGELPGPLAMLTIVEPYVAVLVGLVLLHEKLSTRPVDVVLLVLSTVAVTAGVIIVTRSRGSDAVPTHLPSLAVPTETAGGGAQAPGAARPVDAPGNR